MTPALSIVIPTHKRVAILRQCLAHLEKQTIAAELEVIVVSDGPDDAARQVVSDQWSAISSVRYFEIPKSHQGVARNRGVQEATAPTTLFIGDDIFLAPDTCEMHLRMHSGQKSEVSDQSILTTDHSPLMAVLGFTTWDPAVGITKTMRWLEKSGWQCGYPKIAHYAHGFLPQSIQHRFTYTSHISLPTEVAKKYPFREDVSLYGWEDIEWGLRLAKAGIPLFYEPAAKALHHHAMTLEESLKRMETLGRSAVEIERIAPELNVVPKGWRRLAYKIAAWLPTMSGHHRRAFLQGIEWKS